MGRTRHGGRKVAALFIASLTGGAAWAAAPTDDPVVIDFPAHWRSAILTQTTSDFVCPGGRQIVVTSTDVPRGGTVTRATTIGAIAIDGAKVNATILGQVNDRLKAYAAPPRISPECTPNSVRLHMFHLDGGTVSNSQRVDIWTEGAK